MFRRTSDAMNRELIRLERLRLQLSALYGVEYNMRRSSAIRGTPFFTGPWPMKLTLSTPIQEEAQC